MPKDADSWGRPYGSARDRRRVWTGSVILLVGAALVGVAVILLDLLWLWVFAVFLIVVGVVVLALGRPRSTSRVPR